jgi:hypothetical protein
VGQGLQRVSPLLTGCKYRSCIVLVGAYSCRSGVLSHHTVLMVSEVILQCCIFLR